VAATQINQLVICRTYFFFFTGSATMCRPKVFTTENRMPKGKSPLLLVYSA
jgi:hypothetical protein